MTKYATTPISQQLQNALTRPEVRRFLPDIRRALAAGDVRQNNVWFFLKWLRWRQNHGLVGTADRSEFETFMGQRKNGEAFRTLLNAIKVFMPGSIEINELRAVYSAWKDEHSPQSNTAVRSPAHPPLRASLPESDLPTDWTDALAHMEQEQLGSDGRRAPPPAQVQRIRNALRQLGFSARSAGWPVRFDQPAITAFVKDMLSRELRPVTIETRLSELIRFAKYIGVDPGLIDVMRQERNYHERQVRLSVKNKEVFLRQTGMTLETIAEAACKRLQDVEQLRGTEAHEFTLFSACRDTALLALCVACAPRRADITKFVVDTSIRRLDTCWEVDYRAMKTGADICYPIDPRLTEFLDQAILLGSDPMYMSASYKRRIGTPFFVKSPRLQPLHANWPYRRMSELLGTGPHIARTLWFEAGARNGAAGVEAAIAICGHRSARTGQHYLTSRSYTESASAAAELLSEIAAGVQVEPEDQSH